MTRLAIFLMSLAMMWACDQQPQTTHSAEVDTLAAVVDAQPVVVPAVEMDTVEEITLEEITPEETIPETSTSEKPSEEPSSELPTPVKQPAPEIIEKPAKVITTQSDIRPIEQAIPTPKVIIKELTPEEKAEEEENPSPPPNNKPTHKEWDALLKKYVSSTGKVNYKGFKADKASLQAYLDILAKGVPESDWAPTEELCYWINAYNAFTIKLIVDNHPLKSITDLGKPWDKPFIKLAGKAYTLNQIENEIIRKRYPNEPRIHFAVNCAAKSCPRLLNAAYLPAQLNVQLDRMTRAFVNNPAANQLSEKKVALSKIFDWYGEDFTKTGTLIEFLNRFARVQIKADAQVSFLEYDWALNE